MTALELKAIVDRMTALGVPQHPRMFFGYIVSGRREWFIRDSRDNGDCASMSNADAVAIQTAWYREKLRELDPDATIHEQCGGYAVHRFPQSRKPVEIFALTPIAAITEAIEEATNEQKNS
mgnify:CR=1 FL=1